jgi:hypothetical protein
MRRAGMRLMAESFTEKVHLWKEEIQHKLWKYWWGPVVLFVAGLFEHRLYELCNRFIDAHSNLSSLKPLLPILASGAVLQPIALAFCLFLLGIFALVAHAYWETLPTKRPIAKADSATGVGWFSFEAQQEVHAHLPFELFIRNCGPRFVRSLRFDPIESRYGLRLYLSEIASLGVGERVRVGYRAGENAEYPGVTGHVINFFEGGTVARDQPPYQVIVRFLDGNLEIVEQHVFEGHPLPKGGVSFKAYPLIASATEKVGLPTSRPCVVPVRYGKDDRNNRTGILLVNETDLVGYDISIPDIPVGSSRLHFWGKVLPRLAKSDGQALLESAIEVSKGSALLGNGLSQEMVRQKIDSISFLITYKDADNRHYTTIARIERDVLSPDGLTARFVEQTLQAPPR